MNTNDQVLVIAGGTQDKEAFHGHGFTNVVISNIDHHGGVSDYSPYEWVYQDAEAVDLEDGTYDWVFIHAGLHHCGSPHKAFCEMLRVARKGVVVFEARDSLFMRLAIRLGLGVSYELEPTALSNDGTGGYRNTHIPNYVYRWTEREVEKTVNSYAPAYQHTFRYFYRLNAPVQRLRMSPSPIKRALGHGMKVIKPVFEKVLPRQCNQFGFLVQKEQSIQPWLTENDGVISPNRQYFKDRFNAEKYNNE